MKKYKLTPTISLSNQIETYKALFDFYGKEGINVIKVEAFQDRDIWNEENYYCFEEIRKIFKEITGSSLNLSMDIPYPGERFFAFLSTGVQKLELQKGRNYYIKSKAKEMREGDFYVSHEEFIQNARADQMIYLDGGRVRARIVEKKENGLVFCPNQNGEVRKRFQIHQTGHVFHRNLREDYLEKIVSFVIKAGIEQPLLSFMSASYDLFEFNMALENRGSCCRGIPRLETSDAKYVMEDFFSFNESGCLGRENLRAIMGDKEFISNYHAILREARRFNQKIIMEILYYYQSWGETLRLDENCMLDLSWLIVHGINDFILSESMSTDLKKLNVFIRALNQIVGQESG